MRAITKLVRKALKVMEKGITQRLKKLQPQNGSDEKFTKGLEKIQRCDIKSKKYGENKMIMHICERWMETATRWGAVK